MGQRHAPAALYPQERSGRIVQEAGWTPGLVWSGAENLAPTGIRSPDSPARSQSLYRLSYRAALYVVDGMVCCTGRGLTEGRRSWGCEF